MTEGEKERVSRKGWRSRNRRLIGLAAEFRTIRYGKPRDALKDLT